MPLAELGWPSNLLGRARLGLEKSSAEEVGLALENRSAEHGLAQHLGLRCRVILRAKLSTAERGRVICKPRRVQASGQVAKSSPAG